MNPYTKLLLQIIAALVIGMILVHWFTGGQPEIVNGTYTPR